MPEHLVQMHACRWIGGTAAGFLVQALKSRAVVPVFSRPADDRTLHNPRVRQR